MMNPKTAEALFALHVDCFMEGLMEAAPNPEEFGLTEEQARPIRDEIVRESMARVNWEEGLESLWNELVA